MLRTARIELSLELSKTTRAWLILSWEWGTRIGESEIPWSCFDLSEQEVEVSGKTGERWLPISARGAKILAFLRKNRPDSSAPWIGKRGRSISSGYIYKLFKRVAQRAGLAHLHPHLLRHSAITAWAENDTPMPYLMQLSGHKSVSGVLFYVKPSKQKLREYFQRR